MKILWIRHLHSKTNTGTTSMFEMPKELLILKHELILILPKSCKSTILRNLDSSKIKTIFLPSLDINFFSRITFSISALFFVTFFALKEKVDVVIFDISSIFASLGLILLGQIGFKRGYLISDDRSPPVEIKGIHGYLTSKHYEVSYYIVKHLFSGITVNTPTLKDMIHKEFSIKESKIAVWSTGTSSIFFKYTPKKSEKDLRNKLGLPNRFLIMYHGVFSKNRGLFESIEAIRILKDHKLDLLLILLGTGPMREELIKLIKKIELEDFVFMIDEVPYEEVPEYIALCDIGIVPLPPENPWWRVSAPLKTLEYLAMGKPIIATNIPLHVEIFDKGCCGRLLSSNNPKEIANAISYLYKNKEILVEMGKVGKKIVIDNYTWEIQARKLEKFIRRISGDIV